jgi:hypothetical protein
VILPFERCNSDYEVLVKCEGAISKVTGHTIVVSGFEIVCIKWFCSGRHEMLCIGEVGEEDRGGGDGLHGGMLKVEWR